MQAALKHLSQCRKQVEGRTDAKRQELEQAQATVDALKDEIAAMEREKASISKAIDRLKE